MRIVTCLKSFGESTELLHNYRLVCYASIDNLGTINAMRLPMPIDTPDTSIAAYSQPNEL
jgi:hypothetical protein